MQFGKGYYSPFDRKYDSTADMQPEVYRADIEKPIVPMQDLAISVTEGQRFGTFINTIQGAMRLGVGSIELQPQMGGGAESTGLESYGKEARQAIKEMAQANKVQLNAVHTPAQIGNLSGLGQDGFNDQQRLNSVEEVKKAINFAADITNGGAVIVHTGEFQRPISDQEWAKNPDGTYKFLGYQEEPGRAITYMVDDRTGKIIQDVRKSQVIREPAYKEADKEYQGTDLRGNSVLIKEKDWIDEEGHFLDPTQTEDLFKRIPHWNKELSRFDSKKLIWGDIEERTARWNKAHPDKERTPAETAFNIQMETQMLQYRGSSLFHGRFYEEEKKERDAIKKSLDYYEELEKKMPKDEMWRVMEADPVVRRVFTGRNLVPTEYRTPTDILKSALRQAEQSMQFTHEASAAADAQADQIQDTLQHVKPIEKYAKEQSMKSYAEAGISAMHETDAKKTARPIFVAPENIFPEMGYGSHPEELIELVKSARKKMVEYITSPKIADPYGERDIDGNLLIVDNQWYQPNTPKEVAIKEANEHIKATFDTQHLGMWRKHFQPKFIEREGRIETKEETDTRFNKWYMEQVEKMHKEDILGHLHIVDSMGSTHTHLPAGQGVFPVVDAVKYLKEKGFTGTMTSEGYAEDQITPGRIATATWRALGTQINSYGSPYGPQAQGGRAWSDVQYGYFGRTYPPYFIFGAYSPSNEWQLWSQVPME